MTEVGEGEGGEEMVVLRVDRAELGKRPVEEKWGIDEREVIQVDRWEFLETP